MLLNTIFSEGYKKLEMLSVSREGNHVAEGRHSPLEIFGTFLLSRILKIEKQRKIKICT
jgi:hypothetical protein